MLNPTQSWFWLVTILLLSIAGCVNQQTTPLSIPSETTQLTTIPQPPPECPSKSRRITYQRLEDIFKQAKLGMNKVELYALDRQILASFGSPQYAKRDPENGIIYEWVNPDCPGWYIRASFNANSYNIQTSEIPPPIATIPPQDSSSELKYTLVGHPTEIGGIAIAPDGKTLISGSSDGQIHFWQLSNGKHLQILKAKDWVNSLKISSDGKKLLSLGSELTTWDMATGKPIQEWKLWEFTSGGLINNFFSQDGSWIVNKVNDEIVNLWNIETQEQINSFSQPEYQLGLGAIAIHPNNRILATTSFRGVGINQNPIVLWDLPSGKKLQTLSGHSSKVLTAEFSPNGQVLATGTSEIKLWNWQKGILNRTLTGQQGKNQLIVSIVFSKDGKRLANGSSNGQIDIWDIPTGQRLKTLTGHNNVITTLLFDPTGQILISGSKDRTVKVWQLN
ncbi:MULTISPECIES: WD40 repeat domain-containing protein [unclassified Coleofasciculus]|uniref:WD40 repeat domain-containing protein n=1 Tax=unclassified Coleofasciculus TaxID=2692782 RepID=UPI0018815114|nr:MULTISPECIES: WD40 repeat domain-containing protein [unclassified Coleofasciculus]MBE9127473.1 WD40 repeat domain-containing protein [Coleofasciculus sp. LEGE 07081]MBE9150745.1 WD40 repeat domain-containing protein [Coleofasciculus sp. LEGE 07092]